MFMMRNSTLQLIGLALVSLIIYLVAFVLPYNLLVYWQTPGLTIAKIAHDDPRAGAAYVLAMLALFLLSWLASRIVLRKSGSGPWAVIIIGALAFTAVMLFLYPVDAVDVFENIIRGRMQSLYGANPFYQVPASFPQDPFLKYIGWADYPTAYGPWWEKIASFASRIAGNGIVANVVVFKGVSILAYVGTALLIGLTLHRVAPERALYGVALFAWNPLVIFTVAGNGHNDAVMTFFVALGLLFLARGRYTLAALAETGGALVKFIPALLVPLIYVAALKKMHGRAAKMRFIVITSLACGILVLLSYGPYWHGGDILGTKWRSTLFTTSLATLVQIVLIPRLGSELADLVVSRGALVLLVGWIGWQMWQVWRVPEAKGREKQSEAEFEQFTSSALLIFVFYLLVGVLWFQSWYAIWPVALAALLPDGMLLRGSVILSMAAAAKMPVFDFVLGFQPGKISPRDIREWQATPATLGVAWLYFAYHFVKSRVRARATQPATSLERKVL